MKSYLLKNIGGRHIMQKNRLFSIFAIGVLLLQLFGTHASFSVSAKSSDNSNKIEVKHVSETDDEITWQVIINPSGEESDGFKTEVLFDLGLGHQDVKHPSDVNVKKQQAGYMLETPEGNSTYKIDLVTKVQDTEKTLFQLHAIATEGTETYEATDEIEIEREEQEKEVAETEKPQEKPTEKSVTPKKTTTNDNQQKIEKTKKNGKAKGNKQKEATHEKKDDTEQEVRKEPEVYVPLEQYGDVPMQKAKAFSPNKKQFMRSNGIDEPTATHKIKKTTSDNICIREVEGTIDFTLPVPEEKKPLDIVVVQDASGSYAGNENQVKQSLRDIVEMLDLSQDRMMVTSYKGFNGWRSYTNLHNYENGNIYDSRIGTRLITTNHTGLSNNRNTLRNGINQITFDDATPTASGLQFAKNQYQAATAGEDLSNRKTVFILITDGVANIQLDGYIHLNRQIGTAWSEANQLYAQTFAEVVRVAGEVKGLGYEVVSAYWENTSVLRNAYGTTYYNNTIGPAARQMVQNVASSPQNYSNNEDLAALIGEMLENLQSVVNEYEGFKTEFEIAPGFELVADSIYLNGSQATYTISGNTVTVNANKVKSGASTLTYKLRETTVHGEETTPITNGMIHYEADEHAFKHSLKIPKANLAGNKNSDRCEVKINKSVALADSNDFTDSIELEQQNDVFTYQLEYQFDGSVSQYDVIQLTDELESVLELVGSQNDVIVQSDDMEDLPHQVSVLSNQSGFTIDLQKQNDSYDYLAGNKLTVTFQAKIREETTQDDLNKYEEQRIPNVASFILDGEPTESDEVYVKPPSKGKIKLIKQDADDKSVVLEGAKFVVKDQAGSVVATLVTNENGVAVSDLLPIGDYVLVEVESPSGYQLIEDQSLSVTVEANKTVQIVVTNKKLEGTIKLIKVDDADQTKKLAGAKFAIKNANGKTVGTLETDENGEAVSEALPIGEYTLQEIEAPYGYELSMDQNLTVTVQANKAAEITVTNKQLSGSINILKVDAEDNTLLLTGAEFELRDETGEVVATGTTNQVGEYHFEDVVVGTYTLIETKAPEGYRLLKKPIEVEITPDKLVITKTIENTEQGWIIPDTGGSGTLGFYTLGLLLMTGAGIFVFRKRHI